jgi:hypothetical protein
MDFSLCGLAQCHRRDTNTHLQETALSGKQAWLLVLSPLDLGLMAPFSSTPPVSLLVRAVTHRPW